VVLRHGDNFTFTFLKIQGSHKNIQVATHLPLHFIECQDKILSCNLVKDLALIKQEQIKFKHEECERNEFGCNSLYHTLSR